MMGDESRRRHVLGWIARRSLRQIVLAVGAVILLASGAFGGLRQAEPDQRGALTLGEPRDAAPVRLTVKGVYWADDLGEAIGPSDFGRYLLVIADVSSGHDASLDSFVVRETLRLNRLDQLAKNTLSRVPVPSEDADPQVIVTDDRVRLAELGPGLTYEVAFIWEQQISEPLPTSIELQTWSHQFRQSSLDDQENWFGRSPDATGRFAVTKFGAS